ncbi:MAG: hypothetical protein KG075_21905 [Alphaproteobacteria bacterium]|nr:hypothetical protein [Alphaproteobacteria bacterium]
MTSATETLVAELREASGDDKWSLFPLSAEARAKELLAEAADLLTTQSALIETLTRERDEARERAGELEKLVIWSADEKRAAEAALAERNFKPVSEAPKDGTPIAGLEAYRYQPYKPDGTRQMNKDGRWQRWNGFGWDNSPEPEAWLPMPSNSALKST